MFVFSILPVPLDPFLGNQNPTQRLAEIRSKIVICENRVRDLEALLTSLILNQDVNGGVVISGVNVTDMNSVRQGLYEARAEEGELRTAEQFWNQIVDSNKQAEKDTFDLSKRA